MIGKPGDHCRSSISPLSLLVVFSKGAHRPTEVVTVHGEVGYSVMNVPILRETVGLSHFARVAVAIRAVVPFDESGVDVFAHL